MIVDTEATADTDLPRPVGAMLGAARRSRGVELIDIARDTRVPLRHLTAIEADSHDDLPALPYAIGFVKAFARAVGVDADLAAARFRSETSKSAHVPVAPAMTPIDERRLPPRALVAGSIAALLLVVGGIVAWSAGAFDGAPPAEPVAAPVVAAAPAMVEAPVAAVASSPPPPTVESGPAATPPPASVPAATGGVVITASEDAWFRVSVYDPAVAKVVTVKSGVLAKGERYVAPARPGLRLWTGRAGALAITVDGRPVPSLGGPVETVKNVSLDASDLRAQLASPPPTRVTGSTKKGG